MLSVAGYTVNDGNSGGNYAVTLNTAKGTITKAASTINAVTDTKVYDGTTNSSKTPTVSGTLYGTDTVTGRTQAFVSKNVLGTNGSTLQVTGYTVNDGNGGGNYAVTTNTATGTITKAPLTVTANDQSKTYGTGLTLGTTAFTTAGLLDSDAVTGVTLTSAGAAASANVTGSPYTITPSAAVGTGLGNYTISYKNGLLTVNKKTLTGSITASNKVYDGNASATILTRTLSGVVGSDVVNYVGGTATFNNKNVWNGKTVTATGLSLSGPAAGNYTVNTTATATANVTKLAITGSITANDKVYDGTTFATIATRTLSGVIGSDVVNYVGGTATFNNKNVGNNKTVTAIGLSLSGVDAGNYSVNTTATTTANITPKAVTVTGITAADKVYDGTTAAVINVKNAKLNGVIAGDVVTLKTVNAKGAFDDKNAGTGKTVTITDLTKTGADAGNYTILKPVATTANITKRSLTVTATGIDKVYDGTTMAVVTLSDNRIKGDVLTDSYTSASFKDNKIGNDKPVTVTGILISGIDAKNYNLVNTTATTKADITRTRTYQSSDFGYQGFEDLAYWNKFLASQNLFSR